MIGGLSVLGISKLTESKVPISFNQSPNATFASNNIVSTSPIDFVSASEKATDVVVHIFAEESKQLAQQRIQERRKQRRSPFDDFFGNDFFGNDFFGGGYNRQQSGSGSGVIVSDDGYIVTNNHVVGFADIIKVTLNDGREVKAVKIGTDPSTDLAVLKIDLSENLPVLKYANSDKVRIGEWVLAVGNPFSYLTSTVTAGIVSAKGRDLNLINDGTNNDAVVNPGNSGGALVNTDGELIGINTAIATPTGVYAGYSFAIPSNLVKRIVKDIIKYGDIERTNLGVTGYDINDSIKKEFKLNTNSGFYIDSVQRGSAAQFSGVLPGDVIVKIDDKDIHQFEDISEKMKYNKVGDEIKLKVVRNGSPKTIKVKLRKGA
ncbi:UNVERIFIED_CONTAM: hypothetical protein GTU68_057927 [Idotea baltica]|nr:hypothetical protein [Idotea baltica]